MTAYVVKSPPIHENSINYFSAELGFYRLGYVVEHFDLKDIKNLKISTDTPVFGGVESLYAVLPHYQGLPYYPDELHDFMHRDVAVKNIANVSPGEFFKPIEEQHKLFTARIKDDSFQCELTIGKLPPETNVIVTQAVKFLSEYRVYVRQGEILNICFYKGKPGIFPDLSTIEAMVERTKDRASAYGMDVGVLETGQTALVEMNDFCCLGNYGLVAIEYAKSIETRWQEIWNLYKSED